jgi:hypothetical protein
MKERRRIAENGQVVVLVALLMVGLLVGTGLAIDGGTAFLERRRMQNAADAAAMAGGRSLAMARADGAELDDADILGTVHHYAQLNGVEEPPNNVVADYVNAESSWVGDVGGGDIPPTATGISATVQIERPSRFMHLVGLNTVPAQAPSIAQTGPPRSYDGWLRPFGLPDNIFGELDSGDLVTIHFGNKNHCGPDDGGNMCTVKWIGENGDEKSQAHRGWWNYNMINEAHCSSTGGASDLKEWMEYGWKGSLKENDEVCSKPGTDTSVFKVALLDELVFIPVYKGFADKSYVVLTITPVYIRAVDDKGSDKSITIELAEPTEAPGEGVADPSEPLIFNAWTVTQWE